MNHTVSGKKIVLILAIGLAVMVPIIYVNITDTDEHKRANADIRVLIDEQYKIMRKEVDEHLQKEQYHAAIDKMQKFVKKFSYRNHYKDAVILEIKMTKGKVKK